VGVACPALLGMRQKICLGLVPFISEACIRGEPHFQHVRTLTATGVELGGHRVLGAGCGEKDMALSHSSSCVGS